LVYMVCVCMFRARTAHACMCLYFRCEYMDTSTAYTHTNVYMYIFSHSHLFGLYADTYTCARTFILQVCVCRYFCVCIHIYTPISQCECAYVALKHCTFRPRVHALCDCVCALVFVYDSNANIVYIYIHIV